MKIVIATPHFPPNHIGGTELIALRYARHFLAQGDQVEIVCIESITADADHPFCVTETYEGITVQRLYYNLAKYPDRQRWEFQNPLVGKWFQDYLAKSRPDILHVLSGYLISGSVIEAGLENKITTLVTLLDYWFICPLITLLRANGQVCPEPVSPGRCVWCMRSSKRRYRSPDVLLKGQLGSGFSAITQSPLMARLMGADREISGIEERRSYLKRLLEKVDGVITHSQFLENRIREYGISPRQWIYLPNGIEADPLARRKLERTVSNPIRIGYLGQIAPHKGIKVLLDAYLELNPAPGQSELHIFGNSQQWPAYSQALIQISQKRSDIYWDGIYHAPDLPKVLENIDVIVVPSIWFENRPTVIMEAFANRVPVIAANLGGMAEMVAQGVDGLLFKPGDAHDLALQLRSILDHPSRLQSLMDGIKPVKTATEELSQIEKLYTKLLPVQPLLEK